MAFVYRADRSRSEFDSPKATSVYPNIGPGTYNTHKQCIVKPRGVEAPFGTTTSKVIPQPNSISTTFTSHHHSIDKSTQLQTNESKATTTDFATCSSIWIEDGKNKYHRRSEVKDNIPRIAVPFNIHGPRLNSWVSDTSYDVGPGQYETVDSFGKELAKKIVKSPNKHQGTKHLTGVRRNAPSIPCAHQCYGYKESSKGELIPQDNTTQYTDNQQRPVGGGRRYYTRKKRTNGGTFSKGLRDTMQDNRDSVPGPGYYNTNGEKTGIRKFHKLHSAFTRPYHITNKSVDKVDETPGPGHYEVIKDTAITTLSSDRGSAAGGYCCFGSTSKRFDDLDESSTSSPGPGYYRTTRGFNRPNIGCKISPEGQCIKVKECNKPGPGYYVLKDLWQPNEASIMNERAKAGCNTFGTTSTRFNNNNTTKRGMGSEVDVDGNIINDNTRTYITRTLSNGERDRVCIDDLVANKKDNINKRHQQQGRMRRTQVPFSSTARRFSIDSKANVSSRSYNGNDVAMNKLTSYNNNNIDKRAVTAINTRSHTKQECNSSFLTRQARFPPPVGVDTCTPGPGYYTIPQDNNWGSGNRIIEGNNTTCSSGIDTGDTIGFTSSQRRFKGDSTPMGNNSSKDDTPGPGSYTTSVDWNKRTFNLLFGDVF